MRRMCTACVCAGLLLSLAGLTGAQTPAAKPAAPAAPRGRTLDAYVRERIDAILKPLDDGAPLSSAEHDLVALFDQVTASAALTDASPFADANYAMQLVSLVEDLPKDSQ